jgi:hypothetical protein
LFLRSSSRELQEGGEARARRFLLPG